MFEIMQGDPENKTKKSLRRDCDLREKWLEKIKRRIKKKSCKKNKRVKKN